MLFNVVKRESTPEKQTELRYPSAPIMFLYTSLLLLIVITILIHFLLNISSKPLSILLIVVAIFSIFFTVFVYFKFNKIIKNKINQLKKKESEYKTVINSTGLYCARYDIKAKTLYDDSNFFKNSENSFIYKDFPQTFINSQSCADECKEDLCNFFKKIENGEQECQTFAYIKIQDFPFRWFSIHSILLSDDNNVHEAIFTAADITEQNEKETVYNKWKQSFAQRKSDSFIFFRSNLSKNLKYDFKEGNLFDTSFMNEVTSFDDTIRIYASTYVNPNDFDKFITFFNSETLLSSYFRGTYIKTFEYQELFSPNMFRWIRVTAEMVQNSFSKDIFIFLLFVDINKEKDDLLEVKKLSELDSLTGILNRNTFIAKFEEIARNSTNDEKHVLILLDIDNFKLVNDTFGHLIGDQALIDITNSLKSIIRSGDILGRLGGDEFLILLKDFTNKVVIEKKIMQIQALLRKSFSYDIQISASLGVAIFPDNGREFNVLYNKIDKALYNSKDKGRDRYIFFDDIQTPSENLLTEIHSGIYDTLKEQLFKKKILLINNVKQISFEIANFFQNDFDITIEETTASALNFLHRAGNSFSLILLNLDFEEINANDFLDNIKSLNTTKNVPIIVFSKESDETFILNCIKKGASDYFKYPFDLNVLKLKSEILIEKQQEFLSEDESYFNAKYRSVMENKNTAVIEYDWLNNIFLYDPSISECIQGTFDSRSFWSILFEDEIADSNDIDKIKKIIDELINDSKKTNTYVEVRLKSSDSTKHWFTINAFKYINDFKFTNKIILTVCDNDKDILIDDKLRFKTEHDVLTGLYNHDTFIKKAEDRLNQAPNVSYILFVCEINNFKFINERFGIKESEKLLQFCANRILFYTDLERGLCGRLSNDSFAMLFSYDIDFFNDSIKILKCFFEDYPLNTKITASGGAYIIDDPTIPIEIIINRASLAKDTTRDSYVSKITVYDNSMNEKQYTEQYIADHMEQALKNGEFIVYLQPQINHSTEEIIGAEALARWVDPIKGIISPVDFIPFFEKNGFISKMDEYIWEKAAIHLQNWIKKGNKQIPISVNVSRQDINDPKLCEKLLTIVNKYDIPINLFRIEITESYFSEDTERIISVVEKLHNNGFLIELDDFGSGYSSLNILKDIQIDILKLDMKFFSGKDDLGRSVPIITSVIKMARLLNIPVIAEGVETKIQADFLLSLGCEIIQGFYYSKPLPVNSFEKDYINTSKKIKKIKAEEIDTSLNASYFCSKDSADSQIFNNFIGAAVIFEYADEKINIIRFNRQLLDIVEINTSSDNPSFIFSKKDLQLFNKGIQESIKNKKTVKIKVHTKGKNGNSILLLFSLKIMAQLQNKSLLFATIDEA